ncbi:VanZ family protein, partial [Halalkalibacterium halodurans]
MHKRFSWLAVILWMTLIFSFSHQPATDSAKLSSGVTEFLFAAIQQLLPHVQLDLEQFHTIIRKLAHFFSYFTLGLLVFHALRQTRLNLYLAREKCIKRQAFLQPLNNTYS